MKELRHESEFIEVSWEDSVKLLNELPAMSPEAKVSAIEQLIRCSSPGIRGRTLRMGAMLFSDDQLVTFLRDDADDVIRNAGLEMLKLRGAKSFNLALEIIKDNDPDVIIQGILILDHLRDPRAYEPLRELLSGSDMNLVQGAIIAIGHLGDARAIPDLLPFLESEPWLQVAAINALGDIRSTVAVPAIKKHLENTFLATIAFEALARIGGSSAFRALTEHWMKFNKEFDTETSIGLLAHVAEGLTKKPELARELISAMAVKLHDPSGNVRQYAARFLLASGGSECDVKAVQVLKDVLGDTTKLPACLNRRSDLIGQMINKGGVLQRWGFMMCIHHPKEIPAEDLGMVIETIADTIQKEGVADRETLQTLLDSVSKIKNNVIAKPILNLYIALPLELRTMATDILRSYREYLKNIARDDIDRATAIVLKAVFGESPEIVVKEIMALSDDQRVTVINQITDQKPVLALVPWDELIQRSRETYTAIVAKVAVNAKLHELLPLLRRILNKEANHDVIRALGILGDKESLPLLISYMTSPSPLVRTYSIEGLGRLGGPEARTVLKKTALSADAKDARIAFKALAECALEEDDSFFRDAVKHSDWYVRLSCVDVLGKYQKPENLTALAHLASDPVSIVAQRAVSFLDSEGGV